MKVNNGADVQHPNWYEHALDLTTVRSAPAGR